MYVAMTRTEQYLYVTAKPEKQSEFFRGLAEDIPVTEVEDPEIDFVEVDRRERETLAVAPPEQSSPVKLSPHDLIDETVFEEIRGGLGTEFGSRIHEFAEDYVRGRVDNVEPLEGETLREQADDLTEYLDQKAGTLTAEKTCVLPLEVNGRRLLFEGVIDLIHETDDVVEIIDYKTDQSTAAVDEYQKQLSIYHHVLKSLHPDKEIRAILYYVASDREINVDPLDNSDLRTLVAGLDPTDNQGSPVAG